MRTKEAKNILLADDSEFFRTMLSEILTEAGHTVSFAREGGEVQKKIQENPDGIDLLIVDLQMPHVDGFGVLKWLNEKGYVGRFPVLVVSGVYKPSDVVKRLKNLGADGLITKGFTPEQALFRVNELLFPREGDKRAERRVPFAIPADYKFNDTTYTGLLLNISASGLYLRTKLSLRPESTVELKFNMPDSDKVFDLKGTVIWSIPSSPVSSLIGGAGILFSSISDEEKEEIRRFVEKETKKIHLE